MNQVQQQIQQFHESLKPVLGLILEQYQGRQSPGVFRLIVQPCRRLLQKCSCKSTMDTSRLCQLAYWLAIDGQKELALQLCEAARAADFSFEFELWPHGIQAIYGLEIRLARELLGQNWQDKVPQQVLLYFFSKQARKRARYPQILQQQQIAQAQGNALQVVLLSALYDLIGLGETGLYPQIEQHRQQIEQATQTYMAWLKELMRGNDQWNH